ncbi:unnamed protein product, partial [Adineta steineri]
LGEGVPSSPVVVNVTGAVEVAGVGVGVEIFNCSCTSIQFKVFNFFIATLCIPLTSTIILDNPSIDPIMPLSDVTSIITPTMGNNSLCQLPYKLDGNSKDIYFCSRLESSSNVSTCFTGDSSEQECLLGKFFNIFVTT